MNNDHFPFKTIIAMAAVGVVLINCANNQVQKMADDCAHRGGVMLRDYTCIKADVLIPAPETKV